MSSDLYYILLFFIFVFLIVLFFLLNFILCLKIFKKIKVNLCILLETFNFKHFFIINLIRLIGCRLAVGTIYVIIKGLGG
jgi:hypothetical protein